MMRRVITSPALYATILALLLIAGCSSDRPFSPVSDANSWNSGTIKTAATQVELYGRVATVDVAAQMITLTGLDTEIYAAADCEIVSVSQGVETPLEFGDIAIDDSVKVCGIEQEDGSLIANRIRVFACGDCTDEYDLAFRGVIASIDYAAGTFTVAERSETITVNEATVIWGRHEDLPSMSSGPAGNPGYGDRYRGEYNISLEFTDLAVGDVVEVRANILDADNLLALNIKLATCSFKKCVEIVAVLASVDVDNRIVTFDGLDWTGYVCPSAILTDAAGTELTLADFAAGETVSIKGFETEENVLNICQMIKTE